MAANSRPRGGRAAAAAVVALLLAGGLAASGRAQGPTTQGQSPATQRQNPAPEKQNPTTSAQAAPGAEGACPDKTQTFLATSEDEGRILGRWVTIAGPKFETEPFESQRGLTAHAVDPVDSSRLLVTDGQSIQLSEDSGCTWKQRHFRQSTYGTVGLQHEVVIQDRIRQLEFGGRTAKRRAYALVAPEEGQAGGVRVLASGNGGKDWEDRSVGLPPIFTRYESTLLVCGDGPCAPAILAASPSDPDVAYVAVAIQVTPTLYRTGDGGATWQQVSRTSQNGGRVTEMSVSPHDPDDVWIVFSGQLGHSRDGGRNWDFPEGLSRVAGLHLSSGATPPQVQVLRRPTTQREPLYPELMRSGDGGRTFGEETLGFPVHGIPTAASGGPSDQVVLATDGPHSVLAFDAAANQFVDVSAPGVGHVAAPQRDQSAEPRYWFRQFGGVAVFVPGAPPEPPPGPGPGERPKLPFAPFDGRAGSGRVPGNLSPAGLDLELGAEGSTVVDYRLDLPELPTPVDVWFLIDTSGSMRGAIEGLRAGFETIIKQLEAAGFDAWFGLATFPAQEVFYDRQADIAPPNAELHAALERLTTDGANTEIHATALYQSVTGEGQESAGIRPGRGATFRPQALKIIVHATDEAYGTLRGGPTIEDAGEAMAAAQVRHVGLDLAAGAPDPFAGADAGGLRSTKRDHDNMGRVTNTLAPAGGVDCNGDGINELQEGDPITCPILRGRDRLDITPAIVSAIRAVRDETAVALTVVDAGGIAVEIENPTRSPVNVKVPNALPFAVRYTCPPEMNGKVADVVLRATVRGAPSAEAVARVGCGVPVSAAAAVPPPRTQRVPPALVPLVVGPPQLLPQVETGLAPLNQTAPAQVAQPSAQAGVATQPGQVATAKQRAGRDGPTPPAADGGQSRERSPAPATTGTLGAGAALAVALGGWAVRRERRGVPAVARV